MSIIPAAVHIRLRVDADDQPKGLSVLTPCVGVGLGRGMLDCHHQVNPSERLNSDNRGRGAEEGNIDWEERHCSNDRRSMLPSSAPPPSHDLWNQDARTDSPCGGNRASPFLTPHPHER
jgi:hypothetical protein